MKSRKNFGLTTDKHYSIFNGFQEDFQIDFSVYLLYNSKKLNFDNLSLLNKIYCNFMNSGYFKDVFGNETYKLVNFDNKFLVTRNMKSNNNLHYEFSDSQLLNCPRSIIEAKSILENEIDDLLESPDFDNYREKIDFRHSFKEVVSYDLDSQEKKIMDDFLKDFPEYQFFYSKNTVKDLLTNKINNQEQKIIVNKNSDFMEHYSKIKTIFPFDFYEKYEDPTSEFRKVKLFLTSDLGLNYFYDTEQIIDNDIWFSFENNNLYCGGCLVHSNEYGTIIESAAIFNKEHNNKNIKQIFKDILNQPEIKKDVIFQTKHLFKDTSDKEIRQLYNSKRLYFTGRETELFLDISYFIDVNKLTDQKEVILEDFYKNILLPNQKLINSDVISNNLLNLNNKIKNKYNSNLVFENNDISRNDFINVCVFLHHKEDIWGHIDRSKINFTFDIELKELNSKEIPAFEIKQFLSTIGINLNNKVFETLIEDLNKLGKYTDFYKENEKLQIFELDYHKLYDFLIEKEVLNKGNIIKIYRIEDDESIGLYRSKKITMNNSKAYDYSHRKIPNNERNLAQIFKSNRYETEYHNQYFFGFLNKKQIENWFKDDINELVKNNHLKVVEYEIPENYAIITNLQVAFNKEKSVILKSLDLNKFFNNDFNKNKKTIKPL